MRRDDLRRSFLSPDGVRDLLPVPDAEALDAIGREAALKHWLTDPCEVCGGSGTMGTHSHVHASTGERLGNQPINCLDCEGRGWLPIGGGVALLSGGAYGLYEDDFLVVPLSMLTDGNEGSDGTAGEGGDA